MKKTLLLAAISLVAVANSNAQTVLTHSTQQNVQGGNSAACTTSGVVADNYYMRVYDLNDFPAIQDTAFIIKIRHGVESTSGGPYKVRGGVYELVSSPLTFGNMSTIALDTADVYPDSNLYYLNIPFDNGYILPGQTIVTELYTPVDAVVGFYIGSNFYFENDTSYIAAPTCGIVEPVSFASVGFAGTHIVLNLYVNQKPTFTNFSVTGWKDYDINFMKSDFEANFSDNDGDTITGVVINTLPAYGDLYLYGNPIALYDTLWSTQMDSLIYTPDPGYYGSDVFAVRARDNHHDANNLNVITINITNWVTGIEENSSTDFAVYPNPATDIVNFPADIKIDQVMVVNLEGKVVINPKSNVKSLDVKDLPAGTYIIQAITESGILESKFVKE